MLESYEATVQGTHIEWGETRPLEVETNQPIQVTITVHNAEQPYTHGPAMAASLNRLAAMNAFSYIDDPVAWQREQREDRPLPGRE